MTRATLSALLSHWLRRPLQLATLIVGLALATALWSGVQAINAEARASYDRAASAVGGGGLDDLVATDGSGIAEETYVALRRAGWMVSPVVEGWMEAEGGRVRLLGIDPLTAPPGTAPAAVAVIDDAPGRFLASGGSILAEPGTAARMARDGLPPVEPVEGLAPGLAFADIAVAQRILGEPGRLTRLVVASEQPRTRAGLSEIAPGLERRTPQMQGDLERLTDSFHLNLTAFGLLSFAVGLFIVHGAVGLAFEQRRPVFRTLRALGVPARRLVAIVSIELLVFAVIAGLIGVVLGYLISAALLPNVAATLRGLYGAPVDGVLSLELWWWAAGLFIAIAGTGIAAAASLWKLGTMPALAPAQPRAWARASATARRRQLAAGGLLALMALGLGVLGSGLVAGFVMLGALLVAAALALPSALDLALSLAARTAGGARSEWFWADTRQQVPGLSLALMALLLALAANIGVGTMVSSFRATFVGWLDQRLASELYVTAGDEAEAAALVAFLTPRADAVLPIRNLEGTVAGAPAEIFGVADHATYRENWPLLDAVPGVWDLVAAGDAVLVNEQLKRREGLRLGDPLVLPGGFATEVGGVYSDYGNPLAQVLVGLTTLEARYPGADFGNFGVRVAPDEVEALKTALTDTFGLPAENMIDQAALKAFSVEVFDRTFTVTGALNVLTLAIAGVAILTSLLTLSAMRLPQLAPVWALGLTRTEISRLEVLRAALLAALTFLLAVPLGLVLAWVLLSVINVEAFGWKIPMRLFPGDWAWLGLLSLVAAGLAAIWPARSLARMAPARLIAVFAQER